MIYYKNADFTAYRAKEKERKQVTYINVPGAFDLETSEQNNKAWIYIWQLGIDNTIVYGRTPEELVDCLQKIKIEMNLSYFCRIILFTHDLKYDFSFIKGYLDFTTENKNSDDFIAKSNREVIKVLCNDCIEFRCSAAYTEQPLEDLGKVVGLPKLELDYSLIRMPETELTQHEMAYAQRDIEILLEYFRIESDEDHYGTIRNLPLTATGKVRKDLDKVARSLDSNFDRKAVGLIANSNIYQQRNYHRYGDFKDSLPGSNDKKYKLHNFYNVVKSATFGGYTYTNKRLIGFDNKNIRSVDFNSQYPAMIAFNKYPSSTFKQLTMPSAEIYNESYKVNGARKRGVVELLQVVFKGISAKSDILRFLPFNKCINWINAHVIENRLQDADAVRYILTDLDFELVLHCYSFGNLVVEKVWQSKAAFVPEYYSSMILSLFQQKNEMKDYRQSLDRSTTAEEDQKYMEIKRHINRLSYGLCVQNPVHTIRIFDDNTKQMQVDRSQLEVVFRKYTQFQWGTFCTAYARYAMLSIIIKMTRGGKDRTILYCDTDSIKYKATPENDEIITQYNIKFKTKVFNICQKKNAANNPYYSYDAIKKLGEVQDEGIYKHFKIGGIKAYFYIKQDNTSKIVVSGMNRNQTYLRSIGTEGGKYYDRSRSTANSKYYVSFEEALRINAETLEAFTADLKIPAEYHPRRNFVYSDTAEEMEVTDYKGSTSKVHTSGFCLYRYTDFELNPDPVEAFLKDRTGDMEVIVNNIARKLNS